MPDARRAGTYPAAAATTANSTDADDERHRVVRLEPEQ